ncbi:MAG: TonB family protein, partial [Deltaproteobacteria bacterium]
MQRRDSNWCPRAPGPAARLWLACALAAAAGCPSPAGSRPAGAGGPAADPAPPLGDPPAGDPSAPGYAYLTAIEPALQGRWVTFLDNCRLRLPGSHPLNDPSLEAAVELQIAPSGEVVARDLTRASGNAEFDEAVRELVEDVRQVAPPPAELLSDDGRAHVIWRFARDRRQAGAAGAAVRRVVFPPERAVPLWIERGDLAEAARRAATAATPEAVAALVDAVAEAAVRAGLSAASPEARRSAVEAAAAGRVRAVADVLVAMARGAEDLALRAAATAALGAAGGADAVPVLVELVREPADEAQRLAAAGALAALGQGDRVWEAVAPRVAAGGPDAAGALRALAAAPSVAAVPALAAAVATGPRARRALAAAALGAALP